MLAHVKNNTLNKSTSSQIDDDFNQRLESYFIDIELQKVVQKDTSNQSILSHEAEIEAEQNQSFEDEMQRTQYQLMKKIMETITQVDFLMIAEYMHKPMAYSLTVREHIQQETNLFIRDLKQ
ncbi:unnamed protein product [Paramecium sonneborni]|uniref:Uncharacterized protein n=1 Tax=Paramecium sonneborni TaxID=65129 RepID=A0A8S1RMV9_9CILI|nr:unnamed protein product [Paramecium sonneborni]